ncbi:MAG: hypothetical protein ACRD22_00255 [Terriglobia bacterium]
MALDTGSLVTSMLGAMEPILKKYWKVVGSYAESESKKTAETLATIETQLATKQIDQEQAHVLLDMQKHATRAVLLTVEGIGLIAAESAINAAFGIIRKVVNDALGFTLIA